jgi:hypothetical protein
MPVMRPRYRGYAQDMSEQDRYPAFEFANDGCRSSSEKEACKLTLELIPPGHLIDSHPVVPFVVQGGPAHQQHRSLLRDNPHRIDAKSTCSVARPARF